MLKSKLKFEAFDRHNKKVKDLEPSKAKAESKAGIKKLTGKEGVKTPYYFIADYFLDDKKKSLGHFFHLGVNKKLEKHFVQVEMKPGKMDKSMSESPKKASTGMAYVKTIDGTKKVHIEPAAGCKISGGKWLPMLKRIKPFLGGLPAVVVIGGEVAASVASETKENKEGAASSENVEEKSMGVDLEQLIGELTGDIKNKIKTIRKKVRTKSVEKEDTAVLDSILTKYKELTKGFETAETAVQDQWKKNYTKILKLLPQIEKLQTTATQLIGKSPKKKTTKKKVTDENNASNEYFEKLLKQIEDGVNGFDSKFKTVQKDLKAGSSKAIKGGEDLINALF